MLALLREFPAGLSHRFSSQPLPHTALTPASTPSRSNVAGGGGVSCDGEMAINSWGWARCPRRLGDRQEGRLKELYWGEGRDKQAEAWLREGAWSHLGPRGMGPSPAGGVAPPSTSTCPLNTAPATDCPPRVGACNTGSGGMQAPVPTPAPHR